jgi:acyl-CoA reductase-like NAD-dependent aldehyde dehydrogenase
MVYENMKIEKKLLDFFLIFSFLFVFWNFFAELAMLTAAAALLAMCIVLVSSQSQSQLTMEQHTALLQVLNLNSTAGGVLGCVRLLF